eukprot:14959998-Alexandrium_andersonii.AAC.1
MPSTRPPSLRTPGAAKVSLTLCRRRAGSRSLRAPWLCPPPLSAMMSWHPFSSFTTSRTRNPLTEVASS